MTNYEVMFIVKATLEDSSLEKQVEDVKAVVNENSSKVIEFKDLGKKKLAYPIKKEISGCYYLMNISATNECVKELDRRLLINENILRHLILKKESE